MRCN